MKLLILIPVLQALAVQSFASCYDSQPDTSRQSVDRFTESKKGPVQAVVHQESSTLPLWMPHGISHKKARAYIHTVNDSLWSLHYKVHEESRYYELYLFNPLEKPNLQDLLDTKNPLNMPSDTIFPLLVRFKGERLICQDSTTTYVAEPYLKSYEWKVSEGNSIDSGQGTERVKVTWKIPSDTNWISLKCTDYWGCVTFFEETLLVSVSPTMDSIIALEGPDTVYIGDEGVMYKIITKSGFAYDQYDYTIPPGVTNVLNNYGSPWLDFPQGATSGNITITVTSNCSPTNQVFSFHVTVLPRSLKPK